MKRECIKHATQAYNTIFKFKEGCYNLGLCLQKVKPKVLQMIEHLSGSDTYIIAEATLDVKAIHLTLQVNTLLASSKPRMGPSTESVPHRFEHPTNSHH
jgi:hypothetical protein